MTNLIHNEFLRKIKNITKEEEDILAKNISSSLLDLHSSKNYDINWQEEYIVDINLSLYQHGLLKDQGLKDYVLVDYLNSNTFLLKDRATSKLIEDNSLLKLDIDDDLNVQYKTSDKYGDKIIDLLDLNIIAFYNSNLARKIFEYKFDKNDSRRIYKLFVFYTAKYTIDLIVEKNKIRNEDELLIYNDIIDFIFDSYEDFTLFIPKWLKSKDSE